MTSRQWARLAFEQGGYSDSDIALRCGLKESTIRGWRRKDDWQPKPKKASKKAREAVETASLSVNWNKAKFPQGALPGEQKALTHALRSKAFEFFSANSKAVISEALGNPEPDELADLQTAAAISLALISEWARKIKLLEEKAKQITDNADIESCGILTAIIIEHEHSEGERAGRSENLKTTRTQKQLVRFCDAIEKLRDKIARENSNYSKIQERIHKVRNDRARLQTDNGENENASGLVAAMHRIADKLDSDADLED